MQKKPALIDLNGTRQYKIVPSVYPPINFFEDLVDPEEMEIIWEIESLTNERLRQEAGDIFLVPATDRISGPGSSVVMAAFTHITKPTRFSDGSYGVYYAGLSEETAIRETVYQREHFLRATNEAPCELTMRMYEGKIKKPLHNIKNKGYEKLHHQSDYSISQAFGKQMRENASWGVIYNSVRHAGGECIAIFRPPAISIPHQTMHLKYVWNGKQITDVLHTTSVLTF